MTKTARQWLLEAAQLSAPKTDAATAAALEQARDLAAQRLADEARAQNDRIASDFLGRQDDLDRARALCFRMKGVDR
jgi:hypothetical protein